MNDLVIITFLRQANGRWEWYACTEGGGKVVEAKDLPDVASCLEQFADWESRKATAQTVAPLRPSRSARKRKR